LWLRTALFSFSIPFPQCLSKLIIAIIVSCENEIGGKTGTSENNADGWYVGITHNLITGVWVGCDDMRIHMQGQSGQGGRTALPVFGRFMQLLYEDPATGIKKGKFPKPARLEKSTECQTVYIAQDTVKVDSIELEEQMLTEELEAIMSGDTIATILPSREE
jgi:membrane carboxypeptidase/penicillin-binding protein